MRKYLLACFVFLLAISASPAFSQAGEPRPSSSALTTLQQLYRDGRISFQSKDDETKFLVALMDIQQTLAELEATKRSGEKGAKLDQALQETRAVQSILASYLGSKEFFGYRLRQGLIAIRIEAGGVYEKLASKYPFLRGVVVGGTVTINPGEKIVSEFNALKTEFYGLLVEAAHLSKTDERIRGLATWGNETRVIYPGQSFGEEIISTQQLWDLKLED